MRYLEYLQNIARRTDDQLANPPFGLMLIMAFSMHLVGMLGLSLIEIGAPPNVPVRNLMLRLGGGDDLDQEEEAALARQAAEIAPAAPAPSPPKAVTPKEISDPEKEAPKQAAKPSPQAATPKPAPSPPPMPRVQRTHTASQYQHAPSGVGNPYGNTRSARAEAMARYEQLLSAWIEKHKIYPKEAYEEAMQGRVILRIRITRNGQVLFSKVEQSSGYALLDEAVIATMRQANPVPVVPPSYPGGKMLEFRIPIDFRMG